MHIADGKLIGQVFAFPLIDEKLHELGFVRGALFDWDYAAYDYTLVKSKVAEYVYLRIYTEAIKGRIEQSDCEVEIKDIYVTGAMYHHGLNLERKIDKKLLDQSNSILKQVAEQLGVEHQITFAEANEAEMDKRRGVRNAR